MRELEDLQDVLEEAQVGHHLEFVLLAPLLHEEVLGLVEGLNRIDGQHFKSLQRRVHQHLEFGQFIPQRLRDQFGEVDFIGVGQLLQHPDDVVLLLELGQA